MMSFISRIREWLTENRCLTYEEREELVRQWYSLWAAINEIYIENQNMWHSEWRRLVREDRPRPWRMERFYAMKIDKLAKKAAEGTGLRVSVTDGCYSGSVTITAMSKNGKETIAIIEKTI